MSVLRREASGKGMLTETADESLRGIFSVDAFSNPRHVRELTWLIAPTATPPVNVSADVSSSLHAEKQICAHRRAPRERRACNIVTNPWATYNIRTWGHASLECPPRYVSHTPKTPMRRVLSFAALVSCSGADKLELTMYGKSRTVPEWQDYHQN